MTQTSTEGSLIQQQTFNFECWAINVQKSHILQSRCTSPLQCEEQKKRNPILQNNLCALCRFEECLKLPQLPEMTFPNNCLTLRHQDGFGIKFNCVDALKLVDNKNDLMKVAIANAWQEARSENSHIKDVVKPFDWTFSTDYKGTLFGSNHQFQVSETDEKIDMEKLKVKQKILFYEDIVLFEDELADNGTAQCSIKIRVMPDSFFLLLRYFLRVDNLLVRINDTRVYYEASKTYLLREYTNKESTLQNMMIPHSLLTNPSELWAHLPTATSLNEKLEFPT